MKFVPWAFVLAVPDLDRSANYFRDVLDFKIDWEDASEWRLASRDGVRLMLGHCPTDKPASELGSHNWFGYVEVDDVDGLHRELKGRGATCTEPKDAHYGMREILVTTLDGHRLVFAEQRSA